MDKYAIAAMELQIPAIETFLEDQKEELVVRAKKWMAAFKNPMEETSEELGEPNVVFDVDRAGILFSIIYCFVCGKSVRIGVTKCRTRSGITCVFHRGNFNKHMSLHHKEYEFIKEN